MGTLGIKFPFVPSEKNFFLGMNETSAEEVKSQLLHLLLTEKGSRLYNVEFGSDLLSFIFEPNDQTTFEEMKSSIQESVSKWIPNLTINNIIIKEDNPLDISDESLDQTIIEQNGGLITKTITSGKKNNSTGDGDPGHTVSVTIDFTINDGVFSQSDSIILRI